VHGSEFVASRFDPRVRRSPGPGRWRTIDRSQVTSEPVQALHDEHCQSADQKYSPYAVDWRFLPNNLLIVKDYLRFHLARLSNNMAASPAFADIWVNTLGRRILSAVDKAGILFVHIPKTGGTSISKILYHRNLPHYPAEFWLTTLGDRVASLPSFSVIRHPVERMVSAYKMARFGGTDIIAYSRYWQARLRGLDSFDAFVDHAFANRQQLEVLPDDLRTQASFILDARGRVMVDRLFALSKVRGLPSELGRWLAVHPIPHLNATPAHPVDVTSEARRKIEEIYRVDCEIHERLMSMGAVADIKGQVAGPAEAAPPATRPPKTAIG
jgi:hypothetical protein